MIRIITSKSLAALRDQAALVPELRTAAEQADRGRQEADSARIEAETAAAAADATREQAEASLGQLEAERDKAQQELADVLRDQAAARALPADLASHVVIELHTAELRDRPGWGDLDWNGRQDAEAAEAARIKKAAAEKIAPLLKAMEQTGLTEAGFKAALVSDLRTPTYHRAADSAVEHRLKLARERVSAAVDLLRLPDAVLVYDDTTMPLLGKPTAARLDRYSSGWDIR